MRVNYRRRNRGFSLIELIIVVVIIGIISAIAIPKMSRGARNAGANTLRLDLAVVRNAIELYATEHDGKFPDGNIAAQLTEYSNFTGTATNAMKRPPNIVYGPYLKAIPQMPVGSKKGATSVYTTSTGGETPPGGAATDSWFWNSADQVLRANLPDTDVDDDTVKYNTY